MTKKSNKVEKTSLKMRKFNLNDIADDATIVLIGKRGSGKSFLTRDILWHKRAFPRGIAVSGSEVANGFYGEVMPKICIKEEHDDALVDSIFKSQRNIIKKMKKGHKLDPRFFLVYDDALHDAKNWKNSKQIKNIFLNGRHYKMMFMLLMQYPLGIPPMLRTNVDYVFILRDNNVQNQKRIWESFAGCIPNFQMFRKIMAIATDNFGCLVVNNKTTSNNLEDQLFFFKASKREDFKLLAKSLWVKDREINGDGSDSDEDMEEDVDLNEDEPMMSATEYYNSKSSGPELIIEKIL